MLPQIKYIYNYLIGTFQCGLKKPGTRIIGGIETEVREGIMKFTTLSSKFVISVMQINKLKKNIFLDVSGKSKNSHLYKFDTFLTIFQFFKH